MSKQQLLTWMDERQADFDDMARRIWAKPQLAYGEDFASSLQQSALSAAGFTVRAGLGGVPTAFVAEYGQDAPIIGILGEFDALPGLSQQASAERNPVVAGGAGHGCGHNLLGTAGVEAVIALRQRMETEGLSGTIRYYGCPAEEVLSGKTFMARDGVFDDLDCALTWHPSSANFAVNVSSAALTSVEYHYSGTTAHAGVAPYLGRSALDAVELMNVGANYLREHVLDGSRIHYTITNGGEAPNIVPDKASVWYFLRAGDREEVDRMLVRLTKIAQGAAMMTETEVTWDIKAGAYHYLVNHTLNDVMYAQAELSGPLGFTDEDHRLAEALVRTVDPQSAANAKKSRVSLFGIKEDGLLPEGWVNQKHESPKAMGGSTDVGDVSWIVPTGQIMTTCAPAGVEVHTWQATASFGSAIGLKGMRQAARIMALSAYELLTDRSGSLLKQARDEFNTSTGGRRYKPAIPEDVAPPLPK